MDGKAKKSESKSSSKKLQMLRQKLAGARKQDDEPGEVKKAQKQKSPRQVKKPTKLRD